MSKGRTLLLITHHSSLITAFSPSVVPRAKLARRLDEFVRARVPFLQVNAVNDADDRRLNRHLLVADGRARGLPVGAHHDLAYSSAQAVGDDDDVSRRLLVEINRVDDQKLDALQIGRLLR